MVKNESERFNEILLLLGVNWKTINNYADGSTILIQNNMGNYPYLLYYKEVWKRAKTAKEGYILLSDKPDIYSRDGFKIKKTYSIRRFIQRQSIHSIGDVDIKWIKTSYTQWPTH